MKTRASEGPSAASYSFSTRVTWRTANTMSMDDRIICCLRFISLARRQRVPGNALWPLRPFTVSKTRLMYNARI